MNIIRSFKGMFFIMHYMFDISFFGISIFMNIIQFLCHCYDSKKRFEQKIKQVLKKVNVKVYKREDI